MGYGSNGINSNGTCMNVGNSLNAARPSIRLYPGVSSGGSFSDLIGGGPAMGHHEQRGHAASRILKQVQQQNESSANLAAGRPAKGCESKSREPVGHSLRRRTIIDANNSRQESENQTCRSQPKVEQEVECTSLCFGSDNAPDSRAHRRQRSQQQEAERPQWMGGHAADTKQRKVIDCSPPPSNPSPSQEEGLPAYNNQAAAGMSRRRDETHEGGFLGHSTSKEASVADKQMYSQAAQMRLKARPF